MILLSADRNTSDYDILAIQEPAKNPSMHATYCDSNSTFRPLYPTNRHTRACFLINKKLPLAYWGVEFPGPDIAILTLRLQGRTITVTNIYSQPTTAAHVDETSPIYRLPEVLGRSGDHILLGDFNLHHPAWSGDRGTRASRMALDLLPMVGQAGLELITPRGLVTWRRSEDSASYCKIDEGIHHGSDHRPVATLLTLPLGGKWQLPTPGKLWRQMDREAVRAGSEHLWTPANFTSRDQIDRYAEYLQDFAAELADNTTPTAKSHHDEGAPRCNWWTRESCKPREEEGVKGGKKSELEEGCPRSERQEAGDLGAGEVGEGEKSSSTRAAHSPSAGARGHHWGFCNHV
ncbi:hypothetical protein CNMCM6106_004754 [Aspergillus hiratsukae]|uniref:Endonuclease/exonuclease/phosphatase domain-containing protein n=1 Tax=Aspergillus hiratsukae TaxID=1194566 RepID=A0A8H6QD88_9EURO|nr:hypothetical protein CNMCM6106_004754 [Aspergillus hiratsukae]